MFCFSNSNSIIRPIATRWNSQFDAIRRLIELRDKLGLVCDELKLPKIQINEMEFLQEYCSLMAPVAQALDILQGEKDCYYGTILPTIISVEKKLINFSRSKLASTAPLAHALLRGLQKRFSDVLSLNERARTYIIATVSHPKFKLRCFPGDERERCKAIFIDCVQCQELDSESSSLQGTACRPSDSSTNFFVFEDDTDSQGSQNKLQAECCQYLDDGDTDLHMLNKYPHVKVIFLHYNCTLPSSAPVERMFSTAGTISTPRRNLLSDSNFEKLLLLKSNKI